MKPIRTIFGPALLAAVVLLAGCAYPISKPLRQQARPGLTPGQVIDRPDAYRGAVVIWGGIIKRVEHPEGGGTTLQVEQYPLNWRGEPKTWEETGGRFLVNIKGYLDPAIYTRGRRVTVGGEIVGVQTSKSEKEQVQYRHPELAGREIYLWKRYVSYYYPPYPYYDDYWNYGWSPPGYYYYGPYPYYYRRPYFWDFGFGWGW